MPKWSERIPIAVPVSMESVAVHAATLFDPDIGGQYTWDTAENVSIEGVPYKLHHIPFYTHILPLLEPEMRLPVVWEANLHEIADMRGMPRMASADIAALVAGIRIGHSECVVDGEAGE